MNPLDLLAADMDPISGATEAYKVGGIALVSMIIMLLVIAIVGRFFFKLIDKMGSRINEVEDNRNKLAETVIKENTASNHAVVNACQAQTQMLNTVLQVMGERPCFNSQTLPIQPERKHRTPFPQKYGHP